MTKRRSVSHRYIAERLLHWRDRHGYREFKLDSLKAMPHFKDDMAITIDSCGVMGVEYDAKLLKATRSKVDRICHHEILHLAFRRLQEALAGLKYSNAMLRPMVRGLHELIEDAINDMVARTTP